MENRRFSENEIHTLITKYDESLGLHLSEVQSIQSEFQTFDTIIPQNEAVARAADWSESKRTFDEKYAGATQVAYSLASEFRERIGLI